MEPARRFDGKKFMWDGQTYPTREQALEAAHKHEGDGFQAKIDGEGDQFYVFTRREIKQTANEGR